jgi:biofilm PGA synthesis N-glycosyltransferase PgaC
MKTLFWFSVISVLYVYIGYPILVAAWARVVRRRPRKGQFPEGRWPSLSIIVAVRNEADRLPDRVRNLLDQRYPGSIEIIVVSDGSTDAPDRALAGFRTGVRLLELPPDGKAAALNAGVLAAHGELLVFADARQEFAPSALAELVGNFIDPSVGAVTGELVLDCEIDASAADSAAADGVGLYWKYEKWIRRNESRVWSTLGTTGAIYALRRSLWRPLPESTLLDDVLAPMRTVLAGYRVIFDERAVAFDCASKEAASEARRKTRTLAGNYQILGLEPRLLVPFVNPVWLQYLSHKVGRLIVPWMLLVLLGASVSLAPQGFVYLAAFVLQAIFYGLAAVGGWLSIRERPARLALMFVVMNYSAIAGLAALRRGREVWR